MASQGALCPTGLRPVHGSCRRRQRQERPLLALCGWRGCGHCVGVRRVCGQGQPCRLLRLHRQRRRFVQQGAGVRGCVGSQLRAMRHGNSGGCDSLGQDEAQSLVIIRIDNSPATKHVKPASSGFKLKHRTACIWEGAEQRSLHLCCLLQNRPSSATPAEPAVHCASSQASCCFQPFKLVLSMACRKLYDRWGQKAGCATGARTVTVLLRGDSTHAVHKVTANTHYMQPRDEQQAPLTLVVPEVRIVWSPHKKHAQSKQRAYVVVAHTASIKCPFPVK
jgi:hypothetical protein